MSTATTTGMWQVRHEGSPTSIDNLTLVEVAAGLQEGQWEPTDEVRGPDDADWVAIENHPLLEETAADLEPPQAQIHEDEARLDMNAMIDVCLVLLVFFILTTSYAALTKRLDAPDAGGEPKKPAPWSPEKVQQLTVHVVVKNGADGNAIYQVEGKQVTPELLVRELKSYVGSTGKTILLMEHDATVTHGAVVKVQDAAKGAGMSRVLVVVPQAK